MTRDGSGRGLGERVGYKGSEVSIQTPKSPEEAGCLWCHTKNATIAVSQISGLDL